MAKELGRTIDLLLQGLLGLGILNAVWGKVSVENLGVHSTLTLGSLLHLFVFQLFPSFNILLEL